MNGIEVEAAIFKHEFARMCPDMDVKKQLALSRRLEQQQQKMINWLIPADESAIESTIGYEQLAVALTAVLGQKLSNPYLKQVFDFGLLEDFDHLYRYANLRPRSGQGRERYRERADRDHRGEAYGGRTPKVSL